MLNKDALEQNSQPLFISFEGGEGCGKTTQLELLQSILAEENIKTVFTREPGGTEDGEAIRAMLLKGEQNKWSTTEELLMFSAARSKHVREIIQPSLAKGKWVISDRFADSSTVYQGYVQQYDMETINMLHNLAVGTCWPDLTILLDIPVSIGLSRKNDQTQSGLDEIRFESHGSEYHEKIRRSFLKLAEENPKRITIVDATGSIEEVQHRIINAINMALAKRVDMLAS